jgi:hypothetical protein
MVHLRAAAAQKPPTRSSLFRKDADPALLLTIYTK